MRLYVNIDGGSRGNPGPAAAAMVVSDHSGRVLFTRSKYLGSGQTNNYAEWSALEGAVNALIFLTGEHGVIEAEVRADSELVVRQFYGVYKIKNQALQEIAGRVRESLKKNPALKIKLVHVPREENKLADAAVNLELDRQEDRHTEKE